MLTSYEAIYSDGRLQWLDQPPPEQEQELRVMVVMEIPQKPQPRQESIGELLRRTRGILGKGKTLDDIDAEIRAMRSEWEREWE
jgi:hypothetical protein